MTYFSTFSGIGGFELGINQTYGVCDVDGSKVGGIESDQESDQRQGLFSKEGQGFSTQDRRASERAADQPNERPLCVGYSEIDRYAVATYESHFPDHKNYGDITAIDADKLPDFDLLVGGFPCQAFSVAGKRRGFLDETRGTLFFDLARILRAKRPKYFVFENVKGMLSHDGGRTFDTVVTTLDELGYDLEWQVLNSKDWGVPQNRERVYVVGHLRGEPRPQVFPLFGGKREDNQADKVSTAIRYPLKFANRNQRNIEGDYAYTVDSMNTGGVMVGTTIRRLTPTEAERLQGFPDAWTLGSDTQRYKQCGNAVTVNVVQAVMQRLFNQPNN